MNLLLRLCGLALALAPALCPATAVQAAELTAKKNVLFIAVDDLNCRVACYGDPQSWDYKFNPIGRNIRPDDYGLSQMRDLLLRVRKPGTKVEIRGDPADPQG